MGGGGREKQTDRQTQTVRITMNEIIENIKSNRLDVCLLLLLKIVDALAKYPAIFFLQMSFITLLVLGCLLSICTGIFACLFVSLFGSVGSVFVFVTLC